MTKNTFTTQREYNFIRGHPFKDEWKDWNDIVRRYHSEGVTKLVSWINKGYRMSDVNERIPPFCMYIMDEVYFLCNQYVSDLTIIKNNENFNFYAYDIFRKSSPQFNAYFCDCECMYEGANIFDNKCEARLEHLQSHILAFIWALYYIADKKKRKHVKKYYKKLERIVLSLPYERLKNIDFDILVNPLNYKRRHYSLLMELYERAYFDGWTKKELKEMPFIFEYLKHARSQAGTIANQSFSDDTILGPELCQELYKMAKEIEFQDFLKIFTIKSQGIFSVDHNVNLDNTSIGKIKELLEQSQTSFLDGLKETIVGSGQKLFTLFCIAATVSLLSRVIVGISVQLILKMLHMIYSFMTGGRDLDKIEQSYAVSQSGDVISIPFIPSMILNYVVNPPKDILTKIWRSNQTDLIMKRIGYLGDIKIDRGVERMIDWIKEVLRKLQQWYGQDVLGIHCGIQGLFEQERSPVIVWFEEVDKLSNSYYDEEFRWTDLEYQVVYSLYKQGLSLTRNAEFSKYKNDIYKVMRQLVCIMEKFKQKGISNQNIRNPPVTIYLYGNTGVGKSSITYPLAVEILQRIHQRENSMIDLKSNWKNMIYMRAPEQEYWDGYENQLVTVFDDFSQQTDSQQNPNVELFEIIRSSNCFPYPLHMASLDQKANTTFTSKIIIVSSNLQSPQCASLNFPEALKRRFDICVKVDRDGRGHTNAFDPTLYKLSRFDMMTGIEEASITYRNMIEECVNAYFGRKNFVTTIESYIDSLFMASEEVVNEEVPATSQAGEVYELASDEPGPSGEQQKPEIKGVKKTTKGLRRRDYFQNEDNLIALREKAYFTKPIYDETGNILNFPDSRYDYDEDNPFDCIRYLYNEVWKPCVPIVQRKWDEFMSKHAYLRNALITIGIIGAGLMFLKVFQNLTSIFSKKEKRTITEHEYVNGERLPRSVRKRSSSMCYKAGSESAQAESYNPPKAQIAKTEGYEQPKVQVAKTEGYEQPKVQVAKIEGVKDINATEILMKVVRTNLYKMYESTQGAAIGHVFFLKGKVAIMPKHYLAGLYQALRNDTDASVYFEAVLLRRTFEIKIRDLLATKKEYESPNEEDGPVFSRDLMAVSVKTSIYHSDATQYFVTKNSVCRTDCTEICLPTLINNDVKNSDRAFVMIRNAKGRSELTVTETLPVSDKDDIVSRYIRNAWMYNLDTQETECGAPLIVRNTHIQPGKICGIHIAGMTGTGQGWATPVYEEDVLKIIRLFPENEISTLKIRLQMNEFPQEQGQIPQEAEFIRLGQLKQKISQPVKSKIVPSPLYAKITEPTTKPCALRPVIVNGEEFNPRSYRLNRLGNITVPISEQLIDNSMNALIDEISTVFKKTENLMNENCKSVYTFEEACLGIDGEPYINSIKRDTSSGFPFVTMPNFTRKDIFGKSEEYRLDTPQCDILRNRVNHIITAAKDGVALDHYFVDTLKDERKPIHKAHKTRLFSAGPIDYLIACKMYFNGIVNLLSKNRNFCHVSVGTNVYSNDWDNIVKILEAKSKEMIAGDFEGFDASQHQRLLEAACEVLIQLSIRFLNTTPEEAKIMRVLCVTLINSLHICGDEVYQWTHSLASGHYLTAIINSIFVNLAFGCVWQIAHDRMSYKCAREFWIKCGIVAYGDDHIVSIPLSEIRYMNQQNLPKFMNKIGLTYTLENKDTECNYKTRKIVDLTYLKRSFLFDKQLNRYICPLDIKTVLEFPMWNHKCADPVKQTIVELEKCIEELSLHDEETWQQWIPVLRKCGQDLGFYTDKVNQGETRLVALGQTQYL